MNFGGDNYDLRKIQLSSLRRLAKKYKDQISLELTAPMPDQIKILSLVSKRAEIKAEIEILKGA